MYQFEFHNTDPGELARRRKLASARTSREQERRTLIARLAYTEQRAARLRAWIGSYEARDGVAASPELGRMLDWARQQLAALDAEIDPARVSETLRQRDLFPEVDALFDQHGEPPPRQPWGR